VAVDLTPVRAAIDRIAADVDELAWARQVQDLNTCSPVQQATEPADLRTARCLPPASTSIKYSALGVACLAVPADDA
jgi:hypothetical protein